MIDHGGHASPAVDVDLIFLSRDLSPPRPDVWRAITSQEGVRLRVHRVAGPALPSDPNRWATIARARNAGKRLGTAPYVMLLDDDVVLGPRCVAALVEDLRRRPEFGALGADCAGEMRFGSRDWDCPSHVGMASVLFRRSALDAIAFRWERDKCECRCCCDDLRRAGLAIGYAPRAEAWHQPSTAYAPCAPPHAISSCYVPHGTRRTVPGPAARILVAFDRNHLQKFRRMFVKTLRGAGNSEQVTAVTYGLSAEERSDLGRLPGIEVVSPPFDGHPAKLRLRDFQTVIERWPENTPVAYWDAGDTLFQDRLGALWDLARTQPDRLLVARECFEFRESDCCMGWLDTIRDPESRQRAIDLLERRPILNGGFAAGTAKTFLRYLCEAHRYQTDKELLGSTDWGDQTAMNLYCHGEAGPWLEIPRGWNYCLFGLSPQDYRVRPDGRYESLDGLSVHVVHGNASSFGRRIRTYLGAVPAR